MKLRYLQIWMLVNIVLSFAVGHSWINGYAHEVGGFLTTSLVVVSFAFNIACWPHIHLHKHIEYDEYDSLNWESLKRRSTLLLTKQDFDTLDTLSIGFNEQYKDPFTHPVAKHLIRKRVEDIRVSPYTITSLRYDDDRIGMFAGLEDIQRAARQLNDGQKYGVIYVTPVT